MPISSTALPAKGVLWLPSLFSIRGYKVFFWSNELGEPIHVHIAKGGPKSPSCKLWLTRQGGCVLANNDAKIPQRELNDLMDIVSAQFELICDRWKEFFATDEIEFFC